MWPALRHRCEKHKSGLNGWIIQSSSRFGLGDIVSKNRIAESEKKSKKNFTFCFQEKMSAVNAPLC